MSLPKDLPGTLRDDVDPAALQADLLRLKKQFDELLVRRDAGTTKIRRDPDRRPRCFIIMPFNDQELDVVYEDFVLPALTQIAKLDCQRGDDIFGTNAIINDIREAIRECDLAVADLTRQNANVFYEVGICHTLGKPVLLLAQSKDDIPFDVGHLRVLLYEYSPRGCKYLENMLPEHINAMFEEQD